MEVILNYFMRTPSNIISETNSNKSLDDHIMIPGLTFFFRSHNIAVKIDFFHLIILTEGKSSCCLLKLVYHKYLPLIIGVTLIDCIFIERLYDRLLQWQCVILAKTK